MRTKAIAPIIADNLAGCERCQKCAARCPGHINIPAMLAIFCQCQNGDRSALLPIKDFNKHGIPIDCIECGACTAHCPKHFDIRAAIKELAMQSMQE